MIAIKRFIVTELYVIKSDLEMKCREKRAHHSHLHRAPHPLLWDGATSASPWKQATLEAWTYYPTESFCQVHTQTHTSKASASVNTGSSFSCEAPHEDLAPTTQTPTTHRALHPFKSNAPGFTQIVVKWLYVAEVQSHVFTLLVLLQP